MLIRVHHKSWGIFLVLLTIETAIAFFVKDQFVRPFIGDLLVIWLMVYFFRSFLFIENQTGLIAGVFLFACLIEMAQYFQLLDLLNIQGNRLLMIVLGATFDWLDIAAYGLGAGLLLLSLKLKCER